MRRMRLLGVAIVLLLMCAGCDWAQVGFGPAKSNANPYEPALTTASVAHLTVEWSHACDCTTPLVTGGAVYDARRLSGVTPRDVLLEAVDEHTGATRWMATAHDVIDAQFIAIGNGLAYVEVTPSVGSVTIDALDSATGAARWQTTPPAPSSGPVSLVDGGVVLDGNRIFVAAHADDGTGEISAIDTTGHVVWAATPGGQVRAIAADPGRAVYATSLVPVSAPPGAVPLLTGLNESDGTRRSAVVPQTGLHVPTFNGSDAFAFGNGLVYDGPYAIHPDTGAVAWSAPGEDVIDVTPSAVVTLSSNANGIVSRDPANGTLRWSAPARAIFPQGVVIAGDLVYLGDSGGPDMQIRSLATGAVVGTSPSLLGNDDYISPSGGDIVVQAGGTLYALAPA